jgi:hypothetical protein
MQTTNETYVSPVSGEFVAETDPTSLEAKFKQIVNADLRVGGSAITASERNETPIQKLGYREQHGMFINLHPQALTISIETTLALEELMVDWYRHYPYEATYAQNQHGVPMLLTRFDGMINPEGTIGLCEFDDVPTGFNSLKTINPVAASYAEAVREQQEHPLYSVLMHEDGYVYPHDDDLWLPSINGHDPDEVAVIPRGRRLAPRFEEFIARWKEQSIVSAEERDHKGPLVAMGVGVLAANLAVTLELASRVKSQQPIFIKGLRSSRTELAAVMASDAHKIHGNSKPGNVIKKFDRAGIKPDDDYPIVIQPFFKPPTMGELGLTFLGSDTEAMRQIEQTSRYPTHYETAIPGNEHKYHVLSRIYGVYLPGLGHKIVGGFWNSRPTAGTIHGAADAIIGPLYVEDLPEYTSA